ncbi:adenosylcobinamide-phosphate synthase CbiB [Marinomonas algarum]|uniref:Cobalamin biosynthesis protein CobD n=1 Tax=Marinomonas algarum TaxID=2883105 RepID=A0A9X1ILI5_9GAMM|nr:adenosylcobinamide-phosphate synthase CbiB [Marinomonas algarum]MCB5161467.1 adenosylcobinamide-phosphate synthase CbiB [Marinomonas algarum]
MILFNVDTVVNGFFGEFAQAGWILVAALVLDRLLGEPKSWHPLIWFGRWVDLCRRQLQLPTDVTPVRQRMVGVLAWLFAVVPWVTLLLALFWCLPNWLDSLVSVLVLYFAIGWQSLREHALAIYQPLSATPLTEEKLDQARVAVSYIVSRDTQHLDDSAVAKAGIESVLENGSDAIFAPIFWFVLLGAPGVLLYRLANTLDAMWGYKTTEFLHFGWCAARIDDVLNYVPARLVVYTYAACGRWKSAICSAKQPSARWKSPNAGPVMAAGAGALGIQLGGEAPYFGKMETRPILGNVNGDMPKPKHLKEAILLVDKSVYLWGALIWLLI